MELHLFDPFKLNIDTSGSNFGYFLMDSKYRDLECAFRPYYEFFCDPKCYNTTEEECSNYIRDMANGFKKQREFYKKRNEKLFLIVGCLCFVVWITAMYQINSFIECNIVNSTWHVIFKTLLIPVSLLVGAILLFLFDGFISYLEERKIYNTRFLPERNQNIDNLLDDYLLKLYIYEIAQKLDKNRFNLIYDTLIKVSHPNLEQLKNEIENEMDNPQDDSIIGDVKFGMTEEEMIGTKTLKGISIGKYGIELGFRENVLCNCYGVSNSYAYFVMNNGKATGLRICQSFGTREFEKANELLLLVVGVLSPKYGKPKLNDQRACYDDRVDYCSYCFFVGKKVIVANIYKQNKQGFYKSENFKVGIRVMLQEDLEREREEYQRRKNKSYDSLFPGYSNIPLFVPSK